MKCCSEMHEQIANLLSKSDDFKNQVDNLATVFSLLGESNRMKILLALMEGELCVYHICEITGGKQSATSQHLRKMKDCNILKCRKSGNQVLYSIADDHVKELVRISLEHLKCGICPDKVHCEDCSK